MTLHLRQRYNLLVEQPKPFGDAQHHDLNLLRYGALDRMNTVFVEFNEKFKLNEFLFICTYAGDTECIDFFSDDAKEVLKKFEDLDCLGMHGVRLVAFEMISAELLIEKINTPRPKTRLDAVEDGDTSSSSSDEEERWPDSD